MKDNSTPMPFGLGADVKGTHESTYTCDPTADLPMGSSTQGMTMNGQGGLTDADLMAGFSDGEYRPPPPSADGTIASVITDLVKDENTGGFLERAHGWER